MCRQKKQEDTDVKNRITGRNNGRMRDNQEGRTNKKQAQKNKELM